jgi:hypothetical protein
MHYGILTSFRVASPAFPDSSSSLALPALPCRRALLGGGPGDYQNELLLTQELPSRLGLGPRPGTMLGLGGGRGRCWGWGERH